METQLARNWWTVVLRGVLAIVFGVLAFLWPAITLIVLVLLFGAYALVDGVFALVAAIRNRTRSNRLWQVLVGIAGILAGIIAFLMPGITAFALVYLIAGWAIVTGILEILAAIELRKEISNEWLLALGGVLSVIFGILVAIFPGVGALSVIWMIAAYAIIFGIILVTLGFRLRSHSHRMMEGARATS